MVTVCARPSSIIGIFFLKLGTWLRRAHIQVSLSSNYEKRSHRDQDMHKTANDRLMTALRVKGLRLDKLELEMSQNDITAFDDVFLSLDGVFCYKRWEIRIYHSILAFVCGG